MVNGDNDLYVPRSEKETVKPSHGSVTEAWIAYVAAALERSDRETNDEINSQ